MIAASGSRWYKTQQDLAGPVAWERDLGDGIRLVIESRSGHPNKYMVRLVRKTADGRMRHIVHARHHRTRTDDYTDRVLYTECYDVRTDNLETARVTGCEILLDWARTCADQYHGLYAGINRALLDALLLPSGLPDGMPPLTGHRLDVGDRVMMNIEQVACSPNLTEIKGSGSNRDYYRYMCTHPEEIYTVEELDLTTDPDQASYFLSGPMYGINWYADELILVPNPKTVFEAVKNMTFPQLARCLADQFDVHLNKIGAWLKEPYGIHFQPPEDTKKTEG